MTEAPSVFPDQSGNVVFTDVSATVIAATRPAKYHTNGLITFEVVVPYFVWVELLTHKRLARNAMSHRAAGVQRFAALGWYKPTFHTADAGMNAGAPVDADTQASAERIWEVGADVMINAAQELLDLGICKSEALRMLAPYHMLKGVVTGTEDAWAEVLKLRRHAAADPAMHLLAVAIADHIEKLTTDELWTHSGYHVPYIDPASADLNLNYADQIEVFSRAAACIARVSYGSTDGKANDLQLAARLKASGHLSPFEHIAKAVAMRDLPSAHDAIPRSALLTKNADVDRGFGWVNYRSVIEQAG